MLGRIERVALAPGTRHVAAWVADAVQHLDRQLQLLGRDVLLIVFVEVRSQVLGGDLALFLLLDMLDSSQSRGVAILGIDFDRVPEIPGARTL